MQKPCRQVSLSWHPACRTSASWDLSPEPSPVIRLRSYHGKAIFPPGPTPVTKHCSNVHLLSPLVTPDTTTYKSTSSIFIDLHRSSSIFIDLHRSSSIFIVGLYSSACKTSHMVQMLQYPTIGWRWLKYAEMHLWHYPCLKHLVSLVQG